MSDEDKQDLTALTEQIANLAKAVQGQQKLYDGLKKDIASFKTSKPETKEDDVVSKPLDSNDPVQKQLEALRKQNEMWAKRDEERNLRERNTNFDSGLTKLLLQEGADPKLMEHALIYAKNSGAAKMDEEGNIVFTIDGLEHRGEAGAKAWVKTPAAKLYLPAKGGKGSGNTTQTTDGNKETPSGDGKTKPKYSILELEKQAREAFFGNGSL